MEFLKKYGAFLLVFFVAFAQYSNTFNHDYAWDDSIVLTENTRVQKGLSNVPELFENIKTVKTEHRYGYRPITLLSLAAEVEFFGMSPKAGHVGNTLYYGVLCVLILLFLYRLFPERKMEMLLITLLFTVHPLHTEVVANIKSRDEILAMLFGLIGIMQFRRFLHSYRIIPIILGLFAMVLAFLSKESALTFGGLVILVVIFSDSTIGKKQWIAVGTGFSVVAIMFLIRMFVRSEGFYQDSGVELAEKGVFHYEGFLGNPLLLVTDKLTIFANSLYLIPLYLKQFILPIDLLHDYGYRQLEVVSWSDPIVWFSTALFLGMIMLIIFEFRKRSSIAFGLLWFLISLSIYLHFIQVGTDIYAERFMFAPSLGLCIALVGGVFRIKRLTPAYRKGILIGLCLLFSMLSWKRNVAWTNNESLLTTDLPKLENCVRANYNYAIHLHGRYYSLPEHQKQKAQKEILTYYEQAMSITDRMFNVYMELGSAYMEFGYHDKARKVFEEACVKYDHVAVPFEKMGKFYRTFEQYEKAIPYYEKAIERGERNSDYYYFLAECYYNLAKYYDASVVLESGVRHEVYAGDYFLLMARAYTRLNRLSEAEKVLVQGSELFPEHEGLRTGLQAIRAQTNSNRP